MEGGDEKGDSGRQGLVPQSCSVKLHCLCLFFSVYVETWNSCHM